MTAIEAAREVRTAAALTDYDIEDLDALWCAVRDNGRWLDVLAAMSREEVADRLFDLWEQCRIKVSVRDLIEPIVEQTARDMGLQCPAEIEVDRMTMTPAEVSQRLASIMTELADLADVLDCDLGLVPPADTLDEVCYKISDARRQIEEALE